MAREELALSLSACKSLGCGVIEYLCLSVRCLHSVSYRARCRRVRLTNLVCIAIILGMGTSHNSSNARYIVFVDPI